MFLAPPNTHIFFLIRLMVSSRVLALRLYRREIDDAQFVNRRCCYVS